jgi:hypothetical protein
MKTKSILVALFAFSIFVTSCKKNDDVKPSNDLTTVNKNITGYTQLNVSDPFTVYVTFSNTEEKIQVQANSNLQQYITVEKQNNQLVISLDDNVTINGSSVLNVYITTNQLEGFYAAGASTIQLQNDLNTFNVTINLTGASTFSGALFINELNTNLTGASNMNISGTSASVDLEATGASNMRDYGFATSHFTCDLDGACSAYLTIQQTLNVKARGASNVYYKGNGTVSSQVLTGGSTIQKMN